MADPSKQSESRCTSALFKRAEQLRRWEESETNKESSALLDKPRKLKFTDECVFLAACSAGDKEEVKRLLDKGACINTGNVDGLTALHQACIDDNLDMVEFLVENGADVNCGDNEGWTPLHATASCGFVSIAKYLIENGANVAAVNNDGELPLDIAESDDMEEYLQQEIDKDGIDCDFARNMEEYIMLEDANKMLNSGVILEDNKHPKTGATALHVAAAKGYVKVMSILLQAGLDINAQDFDGWTPLHAAAHWGQKESCKLLVENFCDMDVKNFAGQTAQDIADSDIQKLLEELRQKQITLKKEREKEKPDIQSIFDKMPPPMKRRSSVTRMSVTDKTNAINKDKNQERAQIETTMHEIERKSPVSSSESESEESSEESSSSEDSEVEKRNKANKVESSREVIQTSEPVEVTSKEQSRGSEPPTQAPPVVANEHEDNEDVPSWRRGMRKYGASPIVAEVNNQLKDDNEVVLRRPPINDKDEQKRETWRSATTESVRDESKLTLLSDERHRSRPQSLPADYLGPEFLLAEPLNKPTNARVRSMVAAITQLSQQRNQETPRRERRVAAETPLTINTSVPVTSVTVTLPSTATLTNTSPVVSTTTGTPTTPPAPGTPTTANMQVRRSFVPPVRDEESETQRKAHAKRVRETRRSTQGVTLEDLKSAEQLVQKKNMGIEEQKNVSEPEKLNDTAVNTQGDDGRDVRPSATVERRASWRVRLEQDEDKAPEDAQSVRKSRDVTNDPTITATITLTTSTATTTTTTSPMYTGRIRPQSMNNVSDVDTTVTVTLKSRPQRQSEEDDLKDQDKENEKVPLNAQATQAAIQRRRRPKRRSTGVQYIGIDDGETEKVDEESIRLEDRINTKEDSEEQQAIGDRGYRPSRYGSTSSLSESGSRAETPSRLSERSDRLSRAGSVGSTTSQNDSGEKDYKKLYEEQKLENERLRQKFEKVEQELSESRSQLERALQNNARNVTTDAERRERRALERKLSEMEEEVKLVEKLTQENQRLRDENGALIRVISKLSK